MRFQGPGVNDTRHLLFPCFESTCDRCEHKYYRSHALLHSVVPAKMAGLAVPPAVFVHDAVEGPPGLRAAFGEGSAARALLLDLLPFRTALLPLRACSLACKLLVSECRLTSQNAAGQVPVAKTPKVGLALIEAFGDAQSISIEVNTDWTLENFSACTHPGVTVTATPEWLGNPTFQAASMLRYMRKLSDVQSGFAGSVAQSTYSALAPIAGQLTTLTLRCSGLPSSFADFTSLTTLHFDASSADPFDFGALPLSLRTLHVHAFVRSAQGQVAPFNPACALTELVVSTRQLDDGLVWMNSVPTTLSKLKIRLWFAQVSSDQLLSISRLHRLDSLHLEHVLAVEVHSLTTAQMTAFSHVRSLCLAGNWRLEEHSMAVPMPQLVELQCPVTTFRFPDIAVCMPQLRECTLAAFPSNPHALLQDIDLLMLLHRNLETVMFRCPAARAKEVCQRVHCWVHATVAGGTVWWKPYVLSMPQGMAKPNLPEAASKRDIGWLRLPRDDLSWLERPELFSCRRNHGIWGLRIEGREEALPLPQAPASAAQEAV